MEQKFIVGNANCRLCEGNFKVATAPSIGEAIELFAKHYGIRDRAFLDYVYSMAEKNSFLEQFLVRIGEPDDDSFKKDIKEFF